MCFITIIVTNCKEQLNKRYIQKDLILENNKRYRRVH